MSDLQHWARVLEVRRNFPPDGPPADIQSLNGHTAWVYNIMIVPECDLIATACANGHVLMFALDGDGDPLHDLQAHDRWAWGLGALGGDVIATGGGDGKVVTWRASSGERLDYVQVVSGGEWVTSITGTGDDGFAVGTSGGALLFFSHSGGRDIREVARKYSTYRSRIWDIAVRGDVLVTASHDATAVVWSATEHVRCADLRGHERPVTCAAVSERYIATGSGRETIRLYANEEGYALDRVLEGFHIDRVRMVALVGEDMLMSASVDGTIGFLSLSTGKCEARAVEFGIVLSAAITPDGRIACGGSEAVILSPPTRVANTLKEHAALLYTPLSPLAIIHEPLRIAMTDVTAGQPCASDTCRELATETNCPVSVEEWWCAHGLLMAAVENGEVVGELQFEGSENYCFLKHYTSPTCFALGPDDREKLRWRASEAKESGMISQPEAVLGGVLVGQDLLREVTRLKDAGQNVLSLLSQVLVDQAAADEEMRRLGENLTAVERVQRWNALLTAVFSVAPIGGAAAANAIAALGETVPLLESMVSTAEGVRGGSTPRILDEFIGRSSVLIACDVWETMQSENRVAVKEAAEALGVSWEVFCDMIKRAAVRRAVKIDELGKEETDGSDDERCPVAVEGVADSVQGATASIGSDDESCKGGASDGAADGLLTVIDSEFSSVSSNLRNSDGDLIFDLQELKTASADTVAMKSMPNDALSETVAAIMINFEQDLREHLPALAGCLRNVFRKKSIGGDYIVGFREKEEVLRMIVDGLSEDIVYLDMGVDATFVFEWRLRQFLIGNCSKSAGENCRATFLLKLWLTVLAILLTIMNALEYAGAYSFHVQ